MPNPAVQGDVTPSLATLTATGWLVRGGSLPMADGTTFPTIVADGNYPAVVAGSNPLGGIVWQGGQGTFEVTGTPGGATAVKLQILSSDGTTWIDVGSAVTFAAAAVTAGTAIGGFTAPAGRIRVSVAGSTTPSMKVYIRPIQMSSL